MPWSKSATAREAFHLFIYSVISDIYLVTYSITYSVTYSLTKYHCCTYSFAYPFAQSVNIGVSIAESYNQLLAQSSQLSTAASVLSQLL